jgi:hypothetical protein
MAAIVRGDDPKRLAQNLPHVDVESKRIDAVKHGRIHLCAVPADQGDTSVPDSDLAVHLEWAAISGPTPPVAVSEHPLELLGTITAAARRAILTCEHERSMIEEPKDWPIDNADLT